MRRFEAVLFDLDGTLMQSTQSQTRATKYVADALRSRLVLHNRIPQRVILHTVERVSAEMGLKLLYDRSLWWKEIARRLDVEETISDEFARTLTLGYWSNYARAMKPYKDSIPTLRWLRAEGYKVGLVTDTDGTRGLKSRRLSMIRLVRLFDTVVIAGEDTKGVKPHPSGYLAALRRLNTRPTHAVFVGDNPLTDMRGANRVGMTSILIDRNRAVSDSVKGDAKPSFVISRLGELRKLL